MTKQTRELERLPAWPPNSPDLNLIEVVWSWMVRWIRDSDGGWPHDPELLKPKVLQAWDAVPLGAFRELLRSYRVRLLAIHAHDGDRHPDFALVGVCGMWGVCLMFLFVFWGYLGYI